MPKKIPAYRRRTDQKQAIVTLTDAATKRRKDFWLGEYDSPESRQEYYRVIAAWEANSRRWPDRRNSAGEAGPTIDEIVAPYWRWAKAYYHPNRSGAVRTALRMLRKYHGATRAAEFGPNKLRQLREAMILGDPTADPPRPAWSRRYINLQVQCLRHLFKWAAARELVPAPVHQALCTLEPLKRGRTTAYENPKVQPVPQHLLTATLPYLSKPVRAVVELQLLSGARPGELLGLRATDLQIDDSAGIWTYQPEEHKNAYRERERVIYFGPKAQAVLQPFLGTGDITAPLFSPRAAEADRRAELSMQRKTPLSCGNRPGTNRRAAPQHQPGDRYTTDSYRRAIAYACDRAFPPPAPLAKGDDESHVEWRRRLTPEQRAELREWQKAHRWHPHQLRHNAATELRRTFGLEAAQLALGHASAAITDAVYAERDQARVIEIMRRIG